jgi:hypothetical protein
MPVFMTVVVDLDTKLPVGCAFINAVDGSTAIRKTLGLYERSGDVSSIHLGVAANYIEPSDNALPNLGVWMSHTWLMEHFAYYEDHFPTPPKPPTVQWVSW